jgi:hypothetical protein
VLLGAEEIGVREMAGAHLGQYLAARGDRLRLQGLGRRGGEDLRWHEPPEEVLERDLVDDRDGPCGIGGEGEAAPVAPRLEAVVRVAHRELDRLHLEALAARCLGTDWPLARAEGRAVGHVRRSRTRAAVCTSSASVVRVAQVRSSSACRAAAWDAGSAGSRSTSTFRLSRIFPTMP